MIRIKDLTIERIIMILFSILPVVDSVNGILITHGMPSIGTVYKLFLLGVLALFCLRKGSIQAPILLSCFLIILYIAFSICLNLFVFSGQLINSDFPIKLIFNVITFALLLNCAKSGQLSGKALYSILNMNTWFMIVMILIPYGLGKGYTIYSGGIGYKGFFYSNNELSVALIILFYFSLYRLSQRIRISSIIQLLGITVCVLLLNTKSGMVACLVGIALFIIEYLFRKGAKYKWCILLAIALGLLAAKDFIIAQFLSFMDRQTYLHSLYGGSLLDTIVSGRTFFLEEAWERFVSGPGLPLRLLFGNGFCSNTLIEMDFVDIFFYLGIIGVLALTVFLIYVFVKSIPNFKADHTTIRLFGYILIVGYAFLAGHIVFMATAGCYFVLICCLNLLYRPDGQSCIVENC